mmetsp:Transcript_2693/g.5465  ORF Transcript_2693/g.5465 Transcript_2693/m.5465 type:complete len:117 (-) Transcript_2693:52-402(-)|eukprot:CAMPEP_0181312514 /NCGR_PEP_ID=MMETSP1101-20121128/13740_1 /TAXON_ID=46948 /ORGANISM="Rhodomonas abbreviata, Strain Caron Lab Isolate" /LENGTH=116 /DNA_ID=CAMNT_0023419375 /DNA_START=32 /DNA_END=382 /DNA_ORIENTATION=+
MALPVDNNVLACTYAALILHDENLEIETSKINAIIKEAGVEVEGFWPGLFCSTLKKQDINKLLTTISSGGGGGGGGGGGDAAAPAGGDAAPAGGGKKKEPEPEPEEDADMGFSLFD